MLTEKIRDLVEKACKRETNIYGPEVYEDHFLPVVNFAKQLAQQLNADEEIVEIAGWLHDYASLIGYYEDHHIVGAKEAEKILAGFNYPVAKIEMVKHCIYTHRGSKNIKRKTIEAKILASADAMDHFLGSGLFYLAYSVHNLGKKEGAEFVKNKLERSWNKIMPEGKDIIRKKYEAFKEILKDETK